MVGSPAHNRLTTVRFCVGPQFDIIFMEHVKVLVQINGKVTSYINVPKNASDDTVRILTATSPDIKPFIRGKDTGNIIVIPNKIVNIITR